MLGGVLIGLQRFIIAPRRPQAVTLFLIGAAIGGIDTQQTRAGHQRLGQMLAITLRHRQHIERIAVIGIQRQRSLAGRHRPAEIPRLQRRLGLFSKSFGPIPGRVGGALVGGGLFRSCHGPVLTMLAANIQIQNSTPP